MLKKHLEFSFAFTIIFILQLLSELDLKTTHLMFGGLRYAIKPTITISLMIFYAYQTQFKGRFAKRIFAGLFFGLLGDCFLMFVHLNSNLFMLPSCLFNRSSFIYLCILFRL